MALLVVPRQILREIHVNDLRVSRQPIKKLFLDGPVESFEMSIVIRSSDSAVSMCHLGSFTEMSRELTPIVGLEHMNVEWYRFLHSREKRQGAAGICPFACPCVCIPCPHIKAGEDVYPVSIVLHEMDGIDLDQISRFFNVRTSG